jgi:tyrosyl-tRNA synthetase
MGRTLQKAFGQEVQVALFMPILEGLDGLEKMSKSLNNYIGVSEPPEVIFKKVMEVPDFLIIRYYELATDEHPDTVAAIKSRLENGENPRDIKYELAQTITALYHGKKKMLEARAYYDAVFGSGSIPENIPELDCPGGTYEGLVPVLIENGFIKSKSELLRLISQGGVRLNGSKAGGDFLSLKAADGDVLKIGKKKFLRVKNA